MEEKITVFPKKKKLAKKLNVCAYARVSTGKDTMLHSLSAQVSYYSNLIQNHKGWLYVGVYSDEALSGTKDTREGFNKMVEDARNGKIDLIITKSISRFARNTVTLLKVVRELRQLGIDIYFEEQRIHSLSAEGELMLTILASYAQEEARSVSENMKWRIKKNFEEGIPWGARGSYGYKYVKDHFEIITEEAEIVKRIFDLYISGKGYAGIALLLNKDGLKSRFGNDWTYNSIRQIINNYDYTGNLLLQKTFTVDYLTKKTKVNKGERVQYLAEEAHEAIIDIDTWNKSQETRKARALKVKQFRPASDGYPFRSIVVCGQCGHMYLRKQSKYRVYWICHLYVGYGKEKCSAKQISQQELERVSCEALNMDVFEPTKVEKNIKQIVIYNDNTMKFIFFDGKEVIKEWKVLSRKDSWTPEMREKAAERSRQQNAKNNSNTTKD